METPPKTKIDSLGSLVNDLFGSIRGLETGEPFTGSHDPNGNRFDSKSIPEMFSIIRHLSPQDLQIIDQRLDNFYGVLPNQPQPKNLPAQYTQAKSEMLKLIKEVSTPKS